MHNSDPYRNAILVIESECKYWAAVLEKGYTVCATRP